jgi:hypothetical protein
VTAAPPNPPAPESVPAIPPVDAKNATLAIPNLTFTGPDGGYWPSTVCLAWRHRRRDSFLQRNHVSFTGYNANQPKTIARHRPSSGPVTPLESWGLWYHPGRP